MTPRQFVTGFIRDHEGGLSLRPDDNGNWTGGHRGLGALVGSKFGVTAAALAAHRGCRPMAITAAVMATLTIDESVDIGLSLYFTAPGIDRLPWDRVTASILDMAWGAGGGQAIKLVQRMIGAVPDGQLGPATIAGYAGWRGARHEEDAAFAFAVVRNAFYERIAANEGANDPDRVYLRGWKARTNSFLPGTAWWGAWDRRAA